VSKETLEGHLRGVLATMTPEEVNEDRLKFAKHLAESAGPDLEKLGLHLDTLKIQHVTDDRNYLESIGRQRIAEMIRTAEVAESDAQRAAEEAEAAARGRGQVAVTNSQAIVQRRGNELRQIKAELQALALAEEERAAAAGQQARAEAEVELQGVRGEQESLRLAADVTIPGRDRAPGAGAVRRRPGREHRHRRRGDGQVAGRGRQRLARQRRQGHGHVRPAAPLDAIFGEVARAAQRMKVREVNLLDAGDGKTLPAYAASYPATVGRLLEEITGTLGVDVARVIAGGSAGGAPSPTTPAR
jgi:flotillin